MIAFALLAALAAQPAPMPMPLPAYVHKDTLQTDAFPGHGEHTVMVRTVLDPGHTIPRHIHPGLEVIYVLSGTSRLKRAGSPDRDLKAGESVVVPPRAIHEMINTGPGPLTLLATYVVDPRQPIMQAPK
jgi:quercetin dioxygenase-like cupin family protein